MLRDPDFWRVMLVFVPGAIVFGFTLSTCVSYGRAMRLDRKVEKVTGRASASGLIASHVFYISLSYLFLIAVAMSDTASRFHTNSLEHRAPIRFVGLCFGIWALWKLHKFENKRYQNSAEIHEGYYK